MDLAGVTRHEPVAVEAGRRAAVIAPVLFRDERPHVLFTKRADHLGQHPGQMSFPGGGSEPVDVDLRATALRESNEEIGLLPEEVTFHGRLDDIQTVTDYAVTPFVATIPDREYEPDYREVAEIAALAVDDLTDRANYESELRDHPKYGEVRLHFFHVDGYTVWGATGRMLVQLLELTTEWEAPPEVDRIVDADADYPV
ncbi:NUDIX hydrolase [Haloferax sp. DFSO52]|uniref:NUDIX hydrolase n=1 Tax=Haloferax sp. DFSO52 TaxID=3388505 RepID=UPI003A8A8A7F